jgi:hypothetical protein
MSILDKLLGKPRASSEEEEEKVGVSAGIPILGLDGLSSSAYGPEAALTIVLPLGAGGLAYIGPIITIIIALLALSTRWSRPFPGSTPTPSRSVSSRSSSSPS